MCPQREVEMAYDEGLSERIQDYFEDRPGVTDKKMFGGLCFLINGNMCCGIVKDELMLRVGPDGYDDALAQPHAREMDFTGRALKGMIYVACEGFEEDEDLAAWLERAARFAESLPSKSAKKRAAAGKKKKAAAKKKAGAKKKSGARKKSTFIEDVAAKRKKAAAKRLKG